MGPGLEIRFKNGFSWPRMWSKMESHCVMKVIFLEILLIKCVKEMYSVLDVFVGCGNIDCKSFLNHSHDKLVILASKCITKRNNTKQ